MGQSVVHFEIIGKGPDELRSFYTDLFGSGVQRSGRPDELHARAALRERRRGRHGGGVGGVPEGYDGHATLYVEVGDRRGRARAGRQPRWPALDGSRLGCRRLMGPDSVAGGPVVGLFADPQGHAIGLVASG
jgi:uncharacterized protein